MRRTILPSVIAVAVLVAFTGPAEASFKRAPDRAAQIKLGAFLPEGESEFWSTNEELFTLDVSDFDDFAIGFGLVYSVNNDIEVGLNIDFYDSRFVSEYRDFVDSSGFSILHDTELGIVPVTFDVRWLPFGRHRVRPGGRLVSKPVFYIGAGAGLAFWEYEEVGDFLDFTFDPPEVFFDRFKDDGTTFETHVLAGIELPLSPSMNLLLETKYSFAEDDLGADFGGLGEIDLDGVNAYAGLSFRF